MMKRSDFKRQLNRDRRAKRDLKAMDSDKAPKNRDTRRGAKGKC